MGIFGRTKAMGKWPSLHCPFQKPRDQLLLGDVKIEGPPFPIPFSFPHLSLSCCLSALPAPKRGPLMSRDELSPLKSAKLAREIRAHDFLTQAREERTRIALIISSAVKPHRSPFAFNSLNIPSKCWKRTCNYYHKARSLNKNNLSVKTQKKNASLCLCYLPGVSHPPSSLSTPCISRRLWGSQKSAICHGVVYFF